MTAALATLALGLVAGYLGQRSRLCFVSGYRDWALMRDTKLLSGIGGGFLGAVIGYSVFSAFGGIVPAFPMLLNTPGMGDPLIWILAVGGGLGVGAVGALSGGCPFRMHVLAAEGRRTPLVYLVGFYAGIVFFNTVTGPLLESAGVAL